MTAATVLHLTTPHTSYLIGLLPTGQAAHLYYGPRLAPRKDWSALLQPRAAGYGTMVTYDRNYPTYGLDEVCLETSGLGKGDFREPMVELEGADGQRVTDFVVRSWKQYAASGRCRGFPPVTATARPPRFCSTKPPSRWSWCSAIPPSPNTTLSPAAPGCATPGR